jgi:hypothetical protein
MTVDFPNGAFAKAAQEYRAERDRKGAPRKITPVFWHAILTPQAW